MKNPEYRIDKDILYINIDGKIDATSANEFEEKIISNFCKNLNELSDESLLLKWSSGSIIAKFDTCFEDMDDNTEEEFYSFSFVSTFFLFL